MYYIYLDPLDRGNFHTKDKIDQFCQIQDKKELLNGYFHSRTFFLTPERFRTVLTAFLTLFQRFLNAFWMLFERFFSTPERPKCQERQKPL